MEGDKGLAACLPGAHHKGFMSRWSPCSGSQRGCREMPGSCEDLMSPGAPLRADVAGGQQVQLFPGTIIREGRTGGGGGASHASTPELCVVVRVCRADAAVCVFCASVCWTPCSAQHPYRSAVLMTLSGSGSALLEVGSDFPRCGGACAPRVATCGFPPGSPRLLTPRAILVGARF